VTSKVLWFVVAFIIAPLVPIEGAQAGFLDDLLGYDSGSTQTYTYSVTNSAQPQNPAGVRYEAPGYTPRADPPRQPVVNQRPVAPRVAYQLPPLPNRMYAQGGSRSKAASKKKSIQSAAMNPGLSATRAQTSNPRQHVAPSYHASYPAQPRAGLQQPYSQAPAADYYANPYQTRYATTPNYYQGYSRNLWGSSAQACPPGRA